MKKKPTDKFIIWVSVISATIAGFLISMIIYYETVCRELPPITIEFVEREDNRVIFADHENEDLYYILLNNYDNYFIGEKFLTTYDLPASCKNNQIDVSRGKLGYTLQLDGKKYDLYKED